MLSRAKSGACCRCTMACRAPSCATSRAAPADLQEGEVFRLCMLGAVLPCLDVLPHLCCTAGSLLGWLAASAAVLYAVLSHLRAATAPQCSRVDNRDTMACSTTAMLS